ncbi:hypothetical protein [Thermaerobacter sp. FW80]|uniref:hypothetical protein n=1 Tax=Thermaerobacter sp. FW80 TaxID=2546351 RepID=UPI00143227AA|nr:hypothetical protein [Thermaerobacter sp. FW80]
MRATEALRQGLDGWGGKRARDRAGRGQLRGVVGSRGSVRAAAMAGVVLAGLWLGGCAMGGGGGGGAQAKPSPEEVRSAVRQELQSPEMQAQIQQIITQQVQALAAQQVLLTPEGQKQLVEQLETVAASPQGQAAMQTGVQSFLRSPQGQQLIRQAVTMQLQQMLSGAAGGGGAGGGPVAREEAAWAAAGAAEVAGASAGGRRTRASGRPSLRPRPCAGDRRTVPRVALGRRVQSPRRRSPSHGSARLAVLRRVQGRVRRARPPCPADLVGLHSIPMSLGRSPIGAERRGESNPPGPPRACCG